MADRATRRDPAPDPLADLNDSLGRFLRQADALLDEYSRYSADLRARLTAETDRLGTAVAAATDASLDRALSRIQSRLATLTAPRPRIPRSLVAALILALVCNLALVALLLVRNPVPPSAVPGTGEQGNVVPTPSVPDTVEEGTVVPIDAAVPDAQGADAAPAVDAARPAVRPPPRRRRK